MAHELIWHPLPLDKAHWACTCGKLTIFGFVSEEGRQRLFDQHLPLPEPDPAYLWQQFTRGR